MWLFNDFPKDATAAYGFVPDAAWLDKARLASARIAGGCSASFVSENGLVLSNHHCARSCVQQLSTPEHDFIKDGFYAKEPKDELTCPEMEVNQLLAITDVTRRVNEAAKGLSDQKANEAQKAEQSKIEKECATGDGLRCDVVTLYHGGAYHLYKYRRFQDVRLVFATEFRVASFGGDPDNFMFPRYELDVSFLRVYDHGAPAKTTPFLRWSAAGPKAGELTFVAGNPGATEREATVAELEYQRDVALPTYLLRLAELRGMLREFQRRGLEQKRVSTSELRTIENSLKARRGRYEALLDKSFFARKVAAEESLRARLSGSPALAQKYLPAFDAIQKALDAYRKLRKVYFSEETAPTQSGSLLRFARTLVRGTEELGKPNPLRLREYRDSGLPALKQALFSKAPIDDDLEIETLAFSLVKIREDLGADDPFVRKTLGKDSPEELAERLVKGSRLKDPALRKALWDGGKAAVAASKDPLIEFARLIEPDARAIRKRYDDEIEAVLKRNGERVAQARLEVGAAQRYPDATFTLRLSYGQVKGWIENGKPVEPFTTFGGAFDRATGKAPFELPESWLAAKPKLDLATPLDFATSNDVIGGNSGSPVFNQDLELVGLIFDGNLQSLGGEYGYDGEVNRALAADSAGVLHALDRIYGATRIVAELRR
jgi:hypothetical protein